MEKGGNSHFIILATELTLLLSFMKQEIPNIFLILFKVKHINPFPSPLPPPRFWKSINIIFHRSGEARTLFSNCWVELILDAKATSQTMGCGTLAVCCKPMPGHAFPHL